MKRSKYFQHLISLIQNPLSANQKQIDQQRFDAVLASLQLRPAFLPLVHVLPAIAQNLPTPAQTEEITYPVVITGLISDGEGKTIDYYIDIETDKPNVRIGKDFANTQIRLTIDAIAGKSQETAGFEGVRQFQPFILKESRSLTVLIYNDTGTADTVNSCFIGNRVYSPTSEEAKFTDKTRQDVLNNIAIRPAPVERFAALPVVFDPITGKCSISTPKADEPLMYLGFRSTFRNALVNLGIVDQNSFAKKPFQIEALASEAGNRNRLYNLLNSPLFVPKNQQIAFEFVNTRDGVKFAENGQLEILMSTV